MQQSIPRPRLIEAIQIRLRESPVVVLLGARQVGKTTLAMQIAQQWRETDPTTPVTIFDLERAAGRAALQNTPELTLADCKGLVMIDEVQRLPALFEVLRPLCDDANRKATFLLLGSAGPELVKGVSESLAGRVLFVPVSGLSLSEVGSDQQNALWLRGGFPRAFLAENDEASARWLEGFRQTFLERDIPNLGLRLPAIALERFWTMLAHYHGQTWNASEIAHTLSIGPTVATQYRDVLASTYMLRVLQPWFENIGKRQVKSPKIYFRDSGLLHHFLGINDMLGLRSHPRYGASWEGFALEQILTQHGERDSYFWSTQRGAELDLLLLRGGKRWGFEFKCTDAPSTSKSMHIALEDLKLAHLFVIYPGQTRYPLAPNITALPLTAIADLRLGR